MKHAPKFRPFLPLAGVVVALILAGQARAAGLAEWFGWGTPTTVTTGYAPGYGYYYAPTVSYRTLYAPVAVTSYRPVAACSACGGGEVTSYLPVTTYVQRPILQAYTSYRPVYAAAPACSTCATSYYAPAPACSSCGCSSCGCSTCGCSSCGCSRPACSACGGGCASGACGAAIAPAASAPVYSAASGAPTLSYIAPISSTPYTPTQVYSNANPSYPVAATYTAPAYGSAPVATYPAPSYPQPAYGAPTNVVPGPSPTGSMSPTYGMPMLPNGTPVPGNSVVRPATPTLAPPAPGPSSADVAPSLPGPVPPTPQPPAASPEGTPSDKPKTFEQPTVPSAPPAKPIPDNNRNSAPPSASGSHPPIDPNSRTASSMPMLRPGTYLSTPWPIAKTTAALMPVVPDAADGWHAVR